jgi:hypothetical protein
MAKKKVKDGDPVEYVRPIPFKERPGKLAYNASEVVSIADSRFIFCDNNISESLIEMRFTPQGELAGPLVHHPIRGVRPEAVDDLECMATAEVNGTRLLFLSPSLCLKKKKAKNQKKVKAVKADGKGKISAARESLIRVRMIEGLPEAEIIPCFRYWLIDNSPILGKAPSLVPDAGGLNIEGLAWDPNQNALVFGLRTPVKNGRPLILRVRVKDPTGLWNLSNLEMLPPVTLAIEDADGSQGIRTIEYDPSRGVFLVVVGNAVTGTKSPFVLYSWDGNVEGRVKRFKNLMFHRKMKPEGVTHGTVGGRGAVVFVDDAGGYKLLWDDDHRLQEHPMSARASHAGES